MKKLNNALLIAAFFIIIFLVPILTKLEPVKAVSDFENRKLAQAPVYSTQALVSGKYFAGWETYFSDHVVRRDAWLKSYIFYELRVLGRSVVNSVIIQDDLLLPYFEPQNVPADLDAKSAEMGDKLQKIAIQTEKYGGKFLYLAMPEQYSIFRNSYPKGLYSGADILTARQDAFLGALDARGIEYLSMRPVFEKAGEPKKYYLKTDHHYSIMGAQLTYNALLAKLADMGFDLPAPPEVTFKPINNVFYGSRGRKIYNLSDVSDKLMDFDLSHPVPFTRFDNGVQVEANVFEAPKSSGEPVSYNLYMGGDKAETIITTNRPQLPKVLLFGDSFTNALETFLYTGFDEMRSLDFRHYSNKTLSQYIEEYRPDIVICMRDDTSFLIAEGNGNIE